MKAKLLLTLLLLLLCAALPAQEPGKKLLLEKITSAGCPSCPNGDLLIDGLLAGDTSLVPVAIHVNNANHVDRMWCPDGDSILSDYLWAHPTLMVDRYKYTGIQYVAGTSGSWNNMIQSRKAMPMIATIGGSSSYNPGDRTLSIELGGTVLWDLNWDLRVNAYIVENDVTGTGLGYDQLNGYNNASGHPLQGLGDPIVGYRHNWVLRDMLGGHAGAPAFPNPVPAGHTYSYNFFTTLDTAWDESQIYIILVVQRYDADIERREILNVNKIGLNASVAAGVATPADQPLLALWPNPVARQSPRVQVQTGMAAQWQAQVCDLQGRVVHTAAFAGMEAELDLAGLPAGAYFVTLSAPGVASTVQRLIIQ